MYIHNSQYKMFDVEHFDDFAMFYQQGNSRSSVFGISETDPPPRFA